MAFLNLPVEILVLLGVIAALVVVLLVFSILHRWNMSRVDSDPNRFRTEFRKDSLQSLGIDNIRPISTSMPRPELKPLVENPDFKQDPPTNESITIVRAKPRKKPETKPDRDVPPALPVVPSKLATSPAPASTTESQKETKPESGPIVWAGHATRPRREIIADEIRKTRSQQSPLVFMLIYVNENAAQGQELTSDLIVAWESRLWTVTRQQLQGNGRLERFGELMVGVFLPQKGYEAEEWINEMMDALVTDLRIPEDGVSIGAVLLRDHHEDADAFLNDAIEALKKVQHGGAAMME